MSKAVKAIVGVVMVAVGVVTGNFQLIVMGVLMTASALLTPNAQARQAAATTLQFGEVPRKAVFGTCLVGGSLVDAVNFGGKYGTDFEALAIALADHECDALVGIYVNDVFVPYTGIGIVPGFNGKLIAAWYPGTENQAVDSALTNHAGWGPTDNMAGVSYVVMTYLADKSDEKNPVWPSGRPRFRFVLRGKKCYIARKDSSVGGDGPHRWDDPSTWEWTDNPIDCRYNWVRGVYACNRIDQPDMLLVGRGLSAIEAPPENTFWRANMCDELVPLASGGTERRYRFGFEILADDEFGATEDRFAAACGGVITQPEGSLEIEPGHAKAPVAYITDADLIVGTAAAFSDFRSEADTEWINTVIPRYLEPTQLWADHAAPIRRVFGDVIADGGARELTLSLPINSGTQAQRCGEIRRRIGRLPRTATITLGPRFAELEEGDWIVWTSARRTKGLPVTYRIEAYTLDEKWQITLTLREIAPLCYAWSVADEIAPGAVAQQQSPPTYGGAPDAADWQLAGATMTGAGGAIPVLLLVGIVTDPYVSDVIVEVRQVPLLMAEDGTPILAEDGSYILGEGEPTEWTAEASLPPGATNRTISNGIAPGTAYQVAISYRVAGIVGDRLILGPVLAGAMAVARGAHLIRTQTVPFPLSSDDNSISIAAFGATLDDGSPLDLPAGSLTGLASGTSFGVFWSMTGLAYTATAYPSLIEWESRNNVFLRWQSTSAAGSFPPGDSPPPGDGGDGPNCVTVDSLILMADGSEKPAVGLVVGDLVRTQHEVTLEWGDYRVAAVSFHLEPVWRADGHPDATARHRFWHGEWVLMESLGRPIGAAMVARITIDDAHSYVARRPDCAAGVLSHNLKQNNFA